MKLPDKIDIFYKTYSIKYENDITYADEEIVWGKINYGKKLITVSTLERNNLEIIETLLHEIIHIVVYEMRISPILNNEHEEDIITALTTGLVEILTINNYIKKS